MIEFQILIAIILAFSISIIVTVILTTHTLKKFNSIGGDIENLYTQFTITPSTQYTKDLINQLKVEIEYSDRLIKESFIEVNEKYRLLIIDSCNKYIKGEPILVPKCLIEAKGKGFFDNPMTFNGIEYNFVKLLEVSDFIIKIEVCSKDQISGNVIIYENGIWIDEEYINN